jgi:hypothetical protein
LTTNFGLKKPVLDDARWDLQLNENADILDQALTNVNTLASGTQSALAAHVIDSTDAHPAAAISFEPSGTGLIAITAQSAIAETKHDLDIHNHDLVYAPIIHNHSGTYAPIVHTHTSLEVSYGASSVKIALDDLSTSGTTTAGEISTINTEITDINTHLTTLDGRATTLETNSTDDELRITALEGEITTKQATSAKGQVNGYASLGSDGLVPTSQLPAATPTGVQSINGHSGTTLSIDSDEIPEGVVNFYFTNARADSRADARIAVATIDAATLQSHPASDFSLSTHDHSGTYAPLVHAHDASDITSGVFTDNRLSVNIPRLNATTTTYSGTVIASAFSGDGSLLNNINVPSNLGYTPESQANRGIASGYASLGLDGKIPTSQLPAIAINDTFVVSSQAEMVALIAQRGDVSVRTDINQSFILKDDDASLVGNWQVLLTPTDAVSTVNGQSGNVTLTTSDITEGTRLYWTNGRFDTRLAADTTVEKTASKGMASGYASLDGAGLVPVSQLPASATGGVQSVNSYSGTTITLTTSDIAEGSNEYYTDTKFDAKFASDITPYRTKVSTSYAEMFAVADLASNTGVTADYKINQGGAKNIGKIVISSLSTPPSGTISIDIKIKTDSVSAPTSIFSSLPVLSGNGGINWTSVSTGLSTNTIPNDAMIILEIASADGGQDLRVEIYE